MEIIKTLKIDNVQPISIALGFFDGVHLGHQYILEKAKKFKLHGFTPSVLTFYMDTVLHNSKLNRKKILSDDDRIYLLNKFGIEKLFIPKFSSIKDLSPKSFIEDILIKKLNAKALICGRDFKFGKNAIGDVELLKYYCSKNDIILYICEDVVVLGDRISSTRIREYIKSGDILLANKLLGYRYNINSKVLHGNKIGRKIGYNTINQMFNRDILVPKYGVYSSITYINDIPYASISNIGIKPTIDSLDKTPICETHIIGVDINLYGKFVKVEFLEFIRDEKKFENLFDLKNQINLDIISSINIYNNTYKY